MVRKSTAFGVRRKRSRVWQSHCVTLAGSLTFLFLFYKIEMIIVPISLCYCEELNGLTHKKHLKQLLALAGVAQYIECWPVNGRVAGWIRSGLMPELQTRCPVGGVREATTC